MKKHPLLRTAILVMMAAALLSVSALAAGDETAVNNMYGTFWALIPPVIAITLALITKEAYSPCLSASPSAHCSHRISPPSAHWT